MRATFSITLRAVLVAAALSLGVAGAAGAATLEAGSGSGIAGQTVDIAITASDLTGLGVLAYELAITYEPSLVTATDVIESGTLTGSAGWGHATFNVTSGRIHVSHAGTSALSGAGTLLTVRFVVNSSATSAGFTSLELGDALFNEGSPAVTTTDGFISILPTPTITVTPNQGEIARGETLDFFVSGSVTPPVTWGVTQASVASISSAGVLTGNAPGATRVFADDAAGVRDTTNGLIQVRGMRVTAGSASVVQGNSVSVPITVSDLGGLGVRSGEVRLEFDGGLLQATGIVTSGTLIHGHSPSFGASTGSATVSFAGTSVLSGSGTLFVLQLLAAPSASGLTDLIVDEALFDETLPAARTDGTIDIDPLPTLTVTPESIELLAGETEQFTVSGATPPVTWTTSNASVATISSGGLLTAVAGGVTRVRAQDAVGGSDENTSVTVYDFRLTIPQVYAAPGTTVRVPLLVDRSLAPLDVYSTQFTFHHSAAVITDARIGTGLMPSTWGSPTWNEQPDRITVAGAGAQELGSGNDSLITIDLDISSSAMPGTNVPLTLSGLLCNEGAPSPQVVNGVLHIVTPVSITVTTSPAGLEVTVDGTTYTAPQTFSWMPGSSHTLATASPQGAGGTRRVFASWSDGGAQSHTVTAPSFATTYTASFDTQHRLTTAVTPSGGGAVAAMPASGDGWYAQNAFVQLTATANAGYVFSHWSGDASGSSNPTAVFMDAPKSVTAHFSALTQVTVTTSPTGLEIEVDGNLYTSPQTFNWEPGSSHSLGVDSPQGGGPTRRRFGSWSDGGAQYHVVTAPSSSTTYTATFIAQHLLTTNVSPPEAGFVSVSPTSGDGYYDAGTSVQLTASAFGDYQFTHWSGDVTGSSNPISFTMGAPRIVTANFSATTSITVSTSPPGLAITVDGVGYTAPQSFQWVVGSSHMIATTTPQGVGNTRRVFASWSDGGAISHSVTAPASPTTYTASFTTQHRLTTSSSPPAGGSVSVSPPSGDGFYDAGTSVQLTATANSGFVFSNWSGDVSGSSNPISFVMSAPRNVTANFQAISAITVTTNPTGLAITVDGVGYTAPQNFQWVEGSSHTIATSSPQGAGNTRRVFASWSDGGAISHSVTAPATPTTYTASFTTQHRLTTTVAPAAGGSISVSPPSGDGFYDAGTSVQLTAVPNFGYAFSSWSGDVSGSSNPISLVMSAPRSVTANFQQTGGVDDGPAVFLLRQNAPNPFAGSTRFVLSLAHEGRATLRIFDLRGRLVRTLVDARLTAGAHQALWDGRDRDGHAVRNGVYIAFLSSHGQTEARRVTVMR